MRRWVLMPVLAVLSASVVPLAASAGSGTAPAASPPVATQASSFNLGGAKCSLIEVPAAEGSMPVGAGTCPGVRPGAEVQTEIGLCTLNFLFEAPDKQRYIGTAGHCILGTDSPVSGNNAGEKTWPKGQGPVAKDSAGKRFGEFAYAILQEPLDFSLIRLDPGVEASPEMCQFAGPTGVNEDVSDGPKVLRYFGNGVGIGSTLPARSAVAAGFPSPEHVYAVGLALPGDSGSAVISDDGRAVGVLVTTGVHGVGFDQNGVDFGTMGIIRITPQINQAQKALGLKLTMVTTAQK